MNEYVPVIGLEIHVQLATKSKMFDRCSADWFGKEPNSVVGPLTLGLPGSLPVPNKKAIESALLVGMVLNCRINKVSKFDRKHYFYPDLPKGYQISQYDKPFCYDGHITFLSHVSGAEKTVRIRRAHLEEDTGKLIHDGEDTLVDFNRAGVPLLEIVTEPDFDNSDDVKQFLEELQVLIRYTGVSEGDMEKGSMRLEPNISVRKKSEKELPLYKVEVKNINSFKFAKAAIDYEVKRHIELLEKGEVPSQETRGYNEGKAITLSQRRKEEAADYRYFPEPDIPPFIFDDTFLETIRKRLTELPNERVARYTAAGIPYGDAYILTRDKARADIFDRLLKELDSNELGAKAASMVVHKKINLDDNLKKNSEIVRASMHAKTTDETVLNEVVRKVIAENPKPVADYKNGKENVLMFLVGQVMKEMKGQADAIKVKEALLKAIS